jgi:hypothetical protein
MLTLLSQAKSMPQCHRTHLNMSTVFFQTKKRSIGSQCGHFGDNHDGILLTIALDFTWHTICNSHFRVQYMIRQAVPAMTSTQHPRERHIPFSKE